MGDSVDYDDEVAEVAEEAAPPRERTNTLSNLAYKSLERWAAWQAPNFCLLFTSIIYIALSAFVFTIGYLLLLDTGDDLLNNVAWNYVGSGDAVRPSPCGLPTPDLMHILQTFGRGERGFGFPQLLEPDYNEWSREVKTAVCSNDVYWESAGADGTTCASGGDATECMEDDARELKAFSILANNVTLNPDFSTATDLAGKTAAVAATLTDFSDNVCQDYGNEEGHDSFYSDRLRTAYGDLEARVNRAYVAATPAFYRYASKLTENANKGCLGDNNPYLTMTCPNADHVGEVLGRAGDAAASAQLAGVTFVNDPPLSEKLYALMALSVVGHIDRTKNGGSCFKNADAKSALDFCADVYTGYPTDTVPYSNLEGYKAIDQTVGATTTCVRDVYPPPPPSAAPYIREVTATTSVDKRTTVIYACASLLQYGLFDLGRLFGLPDIFQRFAVDIRPDARGHFLAAPIYNTLFYNVLEELGTTAYEPTIRLEAYLAYRLASVTIWGMVIASGVGYFALRAVVPTVLQVLRIAGIRTQSDKVPVLTRPRAIQNDTMTLLAAVITFFGGYWTLFLDPSSQSHFPVSGECADWMSSDRHAPGGAYPTSWGKRRFSRYGEQLIGVVMIALSVIPFLYGFLSVLADTRIPNLRRTVVRWTRPGNPTFFAIVIVAFANIFALAVQANESGLAWKKYILATTDTTTEVKTLISDCKAAVMGAFWAGALLGSARSRWTVDRLSLLWKVLWAVLTAALIWVPVAQAAALLPNEWADALKTPTLDPGRQWRIVWVFVFSGIATIGIAFDLRGLYMSAPTGEDGKSRYELMQARKAAVRAKNKENNAPAALPQLQAASSAAPAEHFSLDLSKQQFAPPPTGNRFSFRFTDAQFNGADETGHTMAPLAQRVFGGRREKDKVQYIPMLKVPI